MRSTAAQIFEESIASVIPGTAAASQLVIAGVKESAFTFHLMPNAEGRPI